MNVMPPLKPDTQVMVILRLGLAGEFILHDAYLALPNLSHGHIRSAISKMTRRGWIIEVGRTRKSGHTLLIYTITHDGKAILDSPKNTYPNVKWKPDELAAALGYPK
jgi:hypothetical protein